MKQIINTIHQLNSLKTQYLFDMSFYSHQILICGGAGCVSSNCDSVSAAVDEKLKELKLSEKVKVYQVGCMGMCAVGPIMLILPEKTFYTHCTPQSAKRIVVNHIVNKKILLEHTFFDQSLKKHVPCIDDIDFFKTQIKIALRNCGTIENDSIKAYIAKDGYFAIAKILKV